ncbi:MAG: hypothetical protein NC299_07805 [Lachnospiraceae bacterium]|nr:hypothetical protein [Ruminococcus sp.]MCM1275259.1 hypothetical protein [Lachnospiraceae bacterium]
MGNVLKGNRYRMVDNRSFELPLPVKYELLKEDSTVAEYEISDDCKVSCRIITKYKEEMITPINRPLDISDIYYFFSCRVFQDKTPFTMAELSLLGLEKYNVYDIIRKTRGVTPFDTYWLRFDGDNCNYETAKNAWNSLMSQVGGAAAQSAAPAPQSAASDANVKEILHQHKVDVAAKFAEEANTAKAALSEPEPVSNNTMSADEIEALLLKSGLTDIADEEPAAPEPEPKEEASSGGMMSQEAIEAMLAATAAPEPAAEPEPTPAPVEEKPASGGKMSQEDIEAMLAAATPEPAAEPAPVEEKPASGGKMSQEDIEAMLAAAAAPEPVAEPEPEPVEEKPASGGKMSQEDIEAMLAAAAAPEPVAEPEPEPAPAEEKPTSGGKMSQEDIEAMLAAAAAPEPAAEPEPAPVEEKPAETSGGKMSQADIEALLSGMKEDAGT